MKKILILITTLFISFNVVLAAESCLLSDQASKIRCEREMYLEENISDIARNNNAEEVLGGTFFVSGIEWISESISLVEFEDGHNLFLAEVEFNEDNAIKSFNLVGPETEKNIISEDETNVDSDKGFFESIFIAIKNWFINLFN